MFPSVRQIPSLAIQCTQCRKQNVRFLKCLSKTSKHYAPVWLCNGQADQGTCNRKSYEMDVASGFQFGVVTYFLFASRIKLCMKLLWRDVSLMAIGLMINRDSLSQLPHEGLVTICLHVLLPASGASMSPELQVGSVRSTKWRGQSETWQCFPAVLFSVRSLLLPVFKG